MKARSWWQTVILALPFVPLAYCAEHVMPAGMPTAEGCSGSYSAGEGWQYLRVPVDASERVPVATDGFVVLVGRYDDPELDVDVTGISVQAATDSGDEVPGSLRLLGTAESDNYHGTDVFLGWEAAGALEIGSLLTLSVDATPAPRDQIQRSIGLEVVGPPTPPPTPSLSFGSWMEFQHAIGDPVTCETEGICGPSETISFPSQEELLVGNTTQWQLPAISGMVAWEVRGEARDMSSGAIVPAKPAFVFAAATQPIETGLVLFAHDASEYCATLVLRDLRSGQEAYSLPSCGEPGAPEWTQNDSPLGQCVAPPNEQLKERWCEYHRGEENCAQSGAGPGGGQGGSDSQGEPSSGGQGGSDSQGEAEPESEGSAENPRSKSSTSSACQYGPGDVSSGWGMLGVVAMLLLSVRRSRV